VDGNLRIQGLVEGTVEVVGNLIIAEGATVKADISAHAIQVWGMVEGTITASDKLEIWHTGRVFADVEVSALHIDDNAVFRGKCVIRSAEEPAELAPEEAPPHPQTDGPDS
jgi:cytoskeletal protein CcmA (bactofilin family)